MATGCEDLESRLNHCFAEYLNAEIVLGTIKSIPLAFDWLKSTFMYIRVSPILQFQSKYAFLGNEEPHFIWNPTQSPNPPRIR